MHLINQISYIKQRTFEISADVDRSVLISENTIVATDNIQDSLNLINNKIQTKDEEYQAMKEDIHELKQTKSLLLDGFSQAMETIRVLEQNQIDSDASQSRTERAIMAIFVVTAMIVIMKKYSSVGRMAEPA